MIRATVASLGVALLFALGCATEVESDAVAVDAAPNHESEAPLVGFLIEDGVYDSELFAPLDILHHTPFHAPPGLRVCLIAPSRRPVRTFEGVSIVPDFDYATAPPLEILVIPSAERHLDAAADDPALSAFVKERAAKAKFVLSLCDGAFVLGRAGLLDGRTCTTFPADIAALRTRFPTADVIDNVSFVVDGPIVTSVGGARSYDAALYLVERLFGAQPARGVGRGLVLDWDLRATPHLVVDRLGAERARRAYRQGERIDPSTFVEDGNGVRRPLLELAGDDDRVIVVILFGGAARTSSPPHAGLWCEDSLFELGLYRHAIARFDGEGAGFVAVACPPARDAERFGYPKDAFLKGGSEDGRRAFAEATEELVASGLLPFATLGFDFEFRLLRNGELDPIAADEPGFVGRFRADDERQTYGTPTVWILDRDGTVLAQPFHGNNWEKPATLRHTSRELEAAIARALEITKTDAP